MELRHLRYFVAVAEEQNVTRAALRLHVSQPPLSRQIRDLEEELGVKLFQRTAKSLVLTEAGKLFLNEAREVLLRAEKAVQTVRAIAAGDRGQLRVGYAPSLTVEILPRALGRFENECPGVRVSLHDLSTVECIERLNARKLDVALTVRPSRKEGRGLVFREIVSYPLFCAVCASHPLARRRAVGAEQLRNERFIGYTREDYPEYQEWMSGLFARLRFEPLAMQEYDSVTGLVASVEAGRGVAIVTSSLRALAGPQLKLIPIVPKLPPLVLGAVTASDAPEFATRFIAAVKTAAAGLSRQG